MGIIGGDKKMLYTIKYKCKYVRTHDTIRYKIKYYCLNQWYYCEGDLFDDADRYEKYYFKIIAQDQWKEHDGIRLYSNGWEKLEYLFNRFFDNDIKQFIIAVVEDDMKDKKLLFESYKRKQQLKNNLLGKIVTKGWNEFNYDSDNDISAINRKIAENSVVKEE